VRFIGPASLRLKIVGLIQHDLMPHGIQGRGPNGATETGASGAAVSVMGEAPSGFSLALTAAPLASVSVALLGPRT